jgi:hypothetical protein
LSTVFDDPRALVAVASPYAIRYAGVVTRLSALLCLLWAGCKPPTEVVLAATSDLPESLIASARITVSSSLPGESPQLRCACLDGTCVAPDLTERWPLTAGLRPGRDATLPFSVELAGYSASDCGGDPTLHQLARAHFVDGKRELLRMSLDARCLGVSCLDPDTTCASGNCVPIDFPLVDLGDGDPLSGLDLSATADLNGTPSDLAGVDLAGADLAGAPLIVGPSGSLSTPSIVYTGLDNYQVSWTNQVGQLVAATTQAGSPFVLVDTATATPAERPGSLATSGLVFTEATFPGAIAFTYNNPGNPKSAVTYTNLVPAALPGLAPFDGGVHGFNYDGAQIVAYEHYMPFFTHSGPFPLVPNAGGKFLATSNNGINYAIWYDDASSVLGLYREVDPPSQPYLTSTILKTVAAASDSSAHYLAGSAPAGNAIMWTSVPVSGTPSVSFQSAITTTLPPTSLALASDQGLFVLAYTDATGVYEHVVMNVAGNPVEISSQTIFAAQPGEVVSGVAYAPGPMQGGGAYAWLRSYAGVDSIVATRRSPVLP